MQPRKRKRYIRRTPSRRYVYLMERISGRSWRSVFTGRREIKIGIANNSQTRNKQVDAGIPGKVILLDEFLVDRANFIETELHKKYQNFRFVIRFAKKGSGKTEFFRLTNSQLSEIRYFLRKKSGKTDDTYLVVLTLILILFFLTQIL